MVAINEIENTETDMLMNPFTGSVDSVENWIAEFNSRDNEGMTLEESLSVLIHVQEIEGEWVEIENSSYMDTETWHKKHSEDKCSNLGMSKVWILLNNKGEILNVYNNKQNAEGWQKITSKSSQDICGLLEIEIDEKPFPTNF